MLSVNSLRWRHFKYKNTHNFSLSVFKGDVAFFYLGNYFYSCISIILFCKSCV